MFCILLDMESLAVEACTLHALLHAAVMNLEGNLSDFPLLHDIT